MARPPAMTAVSGELVPRRGGQLPAADPPPKLRSLTAGWLLSVASVHSRRAYRLDLRAWLAWLEDHRVDPLQATRGHVDAWVRVLEATPTERTGRPPAPATVARRVSAIASWYAYLEDQGMVSRVPVSSRSRPRVSAHASNAVSLSREEAVALLRAATEDEDPRRRAVVTVLLLLGLRVAELTGLTVSALGNSRGHRTVKVRRKGGKWQTLALPPLAVDALDAWLHHLAATGGLHAGRLDPDAFVFSTPSGGQITQPTVWRMVRRVAKAAGLPSWDQLHPHALRHSFVTLARESGRTLDDVQDEVGHTDPRTTRRYDRTRANLDRAVSYSVASYLATT